ncbi:MAG TPA: ABC transporter permease [Pyrinomonadaceae bacterium]|jgi:lipooligosaccharide transport system permease protein
MTDLSTPRQVSASPRRDAAASPARLALLRVNFRDARAVWQRHGEVYLRLWKMELAAPLIEPVFMILAFGWGLASLIASNVAGVPYLAFVGAGVLGFAAISRALFESSYGSYFRMVYQSTFDAILATPVEVESLALAEICWATTKALIDAFIILVVLFVFGAATSAWALFAPLPLIAGAFFASAISLGVTAHIHDIDSYNLYLNIYFATIFLCGIWFPVDVLPTALQWLAWAIPLTSAIDVARAFLTGTLKPHHLLEMLYLIVASLVVAEWALRSMRKRMVA